MSDLYRDRIGLQLDQETRRALFDKLRQEPALIPAQGSRLALVLDVVEGEDEYKIFLVGIFPSADSEPAPHPYAVRHRIETFYGAKMDTQILGLGKEGMQ